MTRWLLVFVAAVMTACGVAAHEDDGATSGADIVGVTTDAITVSALDRQTITTKKATCPFAGTAVGQCVATVFRGAHVPPFSGSSITLPKSFQIPQ